ncbi:DUF2989 domain-containing protein [Motilimonas sp. 1_MG-2023]|uniref:DUF2989 domain-containing protein n=1 Tax=Motilimonas TaxID=1914248 RepID=UPI0026E427FE|nr:DUF2989 domain-containing protein [Motilimonas sp. 1_MG-2023]MDO6527968.1 DUF2989 domain-containing protein [Motilimonas sp. 1_MG-2023]
MIKHIGFILLPCLMLLAGCEKQQSIKSICSDTPELCNDLNTDDGWCRNERADVIRSRNEVKDPNIATDLAQYHLLRDFQTYKKCIEKAALVEPIVYKEKKVGRVNALVTAETEIERLEQATANSSEPHLAYYHWRVRGDQAAKARFMAVEDSPALDEPEIALAMASYYFERDSDKTFKLLYRAISNYKNELPPGSIFNSLTTLHLKEKHYEETYIWMHVAKELGNKEVNLRTLERYRTFNDEEKAKLDQHALLLAEKIAEGKFMPADAKFKF